MTGPTERQSEVLEFIRSYLLAKQLPPSRREIAAHLGVHSVTAIQCHLDALEKKGLVVRRKGIARGVFPVEVCGANKS